MCNLYLFYIDNIFFNFKRSEECTYWFFIKMSMLHENIINNIFFIILRKKIISLDVNNII